MAGAFTLLFAGGGTGGHLYPAIAVADEIRRRHPEAGIVFAGTRGRIEARVVPQKGYIFAPLWISGWSRSLKPGNLLFPVKVAAALAQAFALLRRVRPRAVVGTGGYVCGPPVYAASVLGIPTLIQEQNSYPGVTTRLLASRANEVHITFEATRRFLRRTDNVYVTGNPTRATIGSLSRQSGAAAFGLDPGRLTLLVFGGSLGASSINSAVLRLLQGLTEAGAQILWQTGAADFARIDAAVRGAGLHERVQVRAFLDAMDAAYAACDLAVCRAGATTLAELTRAGIPSVLVPYPHAAADHQTENARAMVTGGAAAMCSDAELEQCLGPLLQELMADPQRRAAMADHARALGKPDAAAVLATAVLRLAGVSP